MGFQEMTEDDRQAALAIVHAPTDHDCVRLLRAYWADLERADRSVPGLAYLHLGLLCGMCQRLLDERDTRPVL